MRADHDNSVPRNLITDSGKAILDNDGLTAYVGDAIGFVVAFTNGLKVYLSGDTRPYERHENDHQRFL